MASDMKLILGSASPRRAELLQQLGIRFDVSPAEVDETVFAGEPAEAYLERVTLLKLRAVAAQLPRGARRVVLVADTSVVRDGQILGKPAGVGEAFAMLQLLAGREHRVMTCYRLGYLEHELQEVVCHTETTWVAFRDCSEDSLLRYARTGEGFDKAGGYAIQGVGAYLVERIRGSYANVVGLPTCALVRDLERLGLLEEFPG